MHTIDGYNYMMSLNQKEIARICLKHSYPIQDVNTFFGKFDCTEEQKVFLSRFINNTVYDDYDRLIQLCDCNVYTLLPNVIENSYESLI